MFALPAAETRTGMLRPTGRDPFGEFLNQLARAHDPHDGPDAGCGPDMLMAAVAEGLAAGR